MDPLAQLADIKTPEQISQFPMAYGWWLLLLIIICVFCVIFWQFKQYKTHRKIQKIALKKLSTSATMDDAMVIIKWTVMQYFPRHDIAPLSGKSLADYLAQKLPENKQARFINEITPALQAQYQPTIDIALEQQFIAACKTWLEQALPPKKTGGQDV